MTSNNFPYSVAERLSFLRIAGTDEDFCQKEMQNEHPFAALQQLLAEKSDNAEN